jgi:hypothetical protein
MNECTLFLLGSVVRGSVNTCILRHLSFVAVLVPHFMLSICCMCHALMYLPLIFLGFRVSTFHYDIPIRSCLSLVTLPEAISDIDEPRSVPGFSKAKVSSHNTTATTRLRVFTI